ncbi:hypothetical protein Droror1_Dr00009288 [Drosera rotundifolia]
MKGGDMGVQLGDWIQPSLYRLRQPSLFLSLPLPTPPHTHAAVSASLAAVRHRPTPHLIASPSPSLAPHPNRSDTFNSPLLTASIQVISDFSIFGFPLWQCGVRIVYDVTDQQSFDNVKQRLNEIGRYAMAQAASPAIILKTRKIAPGLRLVDKWAV